MTDVDGREANTALLTAGVVTTGVGVVLATFPNGRILGLAVALAGIVVSTIFAVRAWRGRRRGPRASTDAPDPDRFWNAEERLKSLIGVSAGILLATIGLALLHPTENEWWRLWISGPILVVSTVAFLLVRRRNRAAGARRAR